MVDPFGYYVKILGFTAVETVAADEIHLRPTHLIDTRFPVLLRIAIEGPHLP